MVAKMSKELIAVLQPIILALIAASMPGLIGWLVNRRKGKADASQVLVAAATNATEKLLTPLTARVTQLEAERLKLKDELDKANERIDCLEHENSDLKLKYDKLEHENECLRLENSRLEARNGELTARLESLMDRVGVRRAFPRRLDDSPEKEGQGNE
jgi:regulator of replication initiation timing